MTITLHWWLVPATLAIAGFIAYRNAGSYDFYWPMVAIVYWFAAIAFCLGHWL